MGIKEIITKERTDFSKATKDMTFKEKLSHIWEYYRIWVVAGVIVIGLIAYSVYGRIFPPPQEYANISFIGYVDEEVIELMQKDICESLELDPEKYFIQISAAFELKDDPVGSSAMIQKFYATMAAGEVDIIITSTDEIKVLTMGRLTDDVSLHLPPSLVEAYTNELFYCAEDEGGAVLPYAILLKNSEYLKSLGFQTDNLAVSIVTSKHPEETIRLIEMLLPPLR